MTIEFVSYLIFLREYFHLHFSFIFAGFIEKYFIIRAGFLHELAGIICRTFMNAICIDKADVSIANYITKE